MKAHRLNDVRNDLSLDEGFRRRRQQMPLIVANSGQSAKELLELVGELPRTRAGHQDAAGRILMLRYFAAR